MNCKCGKIIIIVLGPVKVQPIKLSLNLVIHKDGALFNILTPTFHQSENHMDFFFFFNFIFEYNKILPWYQLISFRYKKFNHFFNNKNLYLEQI